MVGWLPPALPALLLLLLPLPQQVQPLRQLLQLGPQVPVVVVQPAAWLVRWVPACQEGALPQRPQRGVQVLPALGPAQAGKQRPKVHRLPALGLAVAVRRKRQAMPRSLAAA